MTSHEYNNKVHLWGQVTIAICIVALIAVPMGLAVYYGVQIVWSKLFEITVSPFITYLISSIIGLLALVPVIGGGALYVANVTGNVNNVKAPAAINGMDICEVEPGTEKGDVVALLATCVTSIVSALIMIAGMVFLAPIFEPIYKSAFFTPAFAVILPALYGALLTPYFLKGVKECIVPFFFPILLVFVLSDKTYATYSSYIMLAMMLVSVIYVWLLHKSDAEND